MPIKIIPGRRASKWLNLYGRTTCKTRYDEYIKSQYIDFIYDEPLEVYDYCPKEKFIVQNTYWNNPLETQQQSIARVLKTTKGGKTTFGNNNVAAELNYLGRIAGMPGGSGLPLRNKF